MRLRWLGVTGVTLLLASLVLTLVGPQLWPTGIMSGQGGMMSGQGGMMGGQGGMMSSDMMGTMMAEDGVMQSMMSGEVAGDPNQPFDQRFLDQMLPHHQMAVHSAQMMIANSERPELRDLAQRITTAQQAEIDQMVQWRASWFPDAPAAPSMMMGGQGGMMGGQGGMMGGQGGMMGGQGGMMGGQGGMMGSQGGMMGGQEQMDRLFLEMMIPHHEAAISMARQALAESERPEIRALAEAIISSQTAEIDEMRGYLRDFFGVATP